MMAIISLYCCEIKIKSMKTVIKKFFSILVGLLIGLVVCEIILHFYNPFPFRYLPKRQNWCYSANQKTVFKNTSDKKVRQYHSIFKKLITGFRGPEPTDSINKLLSR